MEEIKMYEIMIFIAGLLCGIGLTYLIIYLLQRWFDFYGEEWGN